MNQIKVIAVSYTGTRNVGDENCVPHRYFEDIQPIVHLNFGEFPEIDQYSGIDAIIVGGGAIAHTPYICQLMRQRDELSPETPIVLWGVGGAWRSEDPYTSWTEIDLASKEHDILGRRDSLVNDRLGQPPFGEWVPCVSCMHPYLESFRAKKPDHEFVIYENKKTRPMSPREVARSVTDHVLGNDHMSMTEVLDFLSSAETVITSSYHGGYWAALMGRKVVYVPFNGKFYHVPWPAQYARGFEWQAVRGSLPQTRVWEDGLDVSVKATVSVAERLRGLVGQ